MVVSSCIYQKWCRNTPQTYTHTLKHTPHTHTHTHTLSHQIYELVQACSRAMPHITTTTDLPPRIPDFPTDARSLVIHELYTTEYTYVKGLEVVDEVGKTCNFLLSLSLSRTFDPPSSSL